MTDNPMIPTLQRTYSKAKAIANQVVWTSQESIPVSFNIDGLISSGMYGAFKATGRPMYCSAFQVDFTVPSQDPGTLIYVNLLDKNQQPVPGSLLKLYGCSCGNLQTVAPAFLLNVGETIQFNVAVVNGVEEYLPQDATLTYMLNFANGLLGTQGFVTSGGSATAVAGGVTAADYGGLKPPALPSSVSGAITIDTSTGRQWQWFSNDWH